MNVKDIDIFSPIIIILVIFIYLFFGIISFIYHMRGLHHLSTLTYLLVIYGLLTFLIGFFIAKWYTKKKIEIEDVKTYFRSFLDSWESSRLFSRNSVIIIVSLSLILQFINLNLMDGIPLFSGVLKAKAFNPVTMIAYLFFLPFINILIARYYRKEYLLLVLVGVILFALTGYRAITIAILLSILITTFYTSEKKYHYFLTLTPIIIIVGCIVGYLACISIEWQHWNVTPLSLVYIRAGYTLNVLDKIVNMTNPQPGLLSYYIITGFFQSVDPRLVLGEMVFHYKTSITGTIFGPALLELGVIGLGVQMFFLGLVLKLLHPVQKIKKGIYTAFYSIGLSHTIIWVETGPTDLMVWIYYILFVIVLLTGYHALNQKKIK
jgi:oligosaccharide repeat unit polymerase